MSLPPSSQPVLLTAAPRLIVGAFDQALPFYARLGFQTTYHDEGFAIVERDGVTLHMNCDPDAKGGRSVCWITVTNIDALYQQYLPTYAVQSSPKDQPYGFREFFIKDPFCNLIIFAERIAEEEVTSERGE